MEVYHTTNNGLVAARKLGLQLAKGKYIGFVDADDYIEPNMFSELILNLIKTDADFVHSGFIEEINECTNCIGEFDEMIVELNTNQERLDFLCHFVLGKMRISPSIWSKLFKADIIKRCYKNVPNIQQYGEDLLSLCWCIMESRRISLSQKKLYHYIVRENSLSHLDKNKYVENEIGLWNCIIHILNEYKCCDYLKRDIYGFLKERIASVIYKLSDGDIHILQYYFKDINLIIGKKIVIYGAGNVGQAYYAQICKYRNCKIVAWVDLNWDKCTFEYAEVLGVDKILDLEFDVLIIAIDSEKTRKEINDRLVSSGLCSEKIYCQAPGHYF